MSQRTIWQPLREVFCRLLRRHGRVGDYYHATSHGDFCSRCGGRL